MHINYNGMPKKYGDFEYLDLFFEKIHLNDEKYKA